MPIIITIKSNIVNNAIQCRDSKHAEQVFTREALKDGVIVTNDDLDNGFVMVDMGSICITWAIFEDD